MCAQWGDIFAEAFSRSFGKAQDNFLLKKKYEQDMDEFLLKQKAETRRQTYSTAMMENLGYKNKVIRSIFGGQGGGGGEGGGLNTENLPPGTMFSLGGLTVPMNRKYTEGESKALAQSGAILKDLNELKSMYDLGTATPGAQMTGSSVLGLSKTPLIGGQLAGLAMGAGGIGKGGEQRQNFSDLMGNIGERLLRLRSGAQINEQEYTRFIKMLPGLMRNDSLDKKQLDRFISEFSALEGRISSGAMWDKKTNKFTGGETKGTTINLDSLFEDIGDKEEE